MFRPKVRLRDVRIALRDFLKGLRWHGVAGVAGRDEPVFDVWIHEDSVGETANRSTLDISLIQINRADIILVLYTGEAGSGADGQIGICHAELREALDRRPDIVCLVGLKPLRDDGLPRDAAFRRYVGDLSRFRIDVESSAELHTAVGAIVQETVANLVHRGASAGSRKRDQGQALEWKQLDLDTRRAAMREALARVLRGVAITNGMAETLHLVDLPGETGRVAVRIDAIPGGAGTAAARERVGQPFLRDHRHVPALETNDVAGPIHVIACQGGITEGQATTMLGTPDAISVPSHFGVYAADHVQKIQMVFLAQCADETATAIAVRRFEEWLVQAAQGRRIAERASSRRRILATIAREQDSPVPDDRGRRSAKPRRPR